MIHRLTVLSYIPLLSSTLALILNPALREAANASHALHPSPFTLHPFFIPPFSFLHILPSLLHLPEKTAQFFTAASNSQFDYVVLLKIAPEKNSSSNDWASIKLQNYFRPSSIGLRCNLHHFHHQSLCCFPKSFSPEKSLQLLTPKSWLRF